MHVLHAVQQMLHHDWHFQCVHGMQTYLHFDGFEGQSMPHCVILLFLALTMTTATLILLELSVPLAASSFV